MSLLAAMDLNITVHGNGVVDAGLSDQFGRRVSLTVMNAAGDVIDLSQLRIVFTVRQRDFQTPNSLQARIFNLSRETARKIGLGVDHDVEYTRVVLQAGYLRGNFGKIFDGTIKQTRFGRENATDTYLDILAGDADAAYTLAVIQTVIPANVATSTEIVNRCLAVLADFGVTKGHLDPFADRQQARAITLNASVREVLSQVGQDEQMSWSMTAGVLDFYRILSTLPDPAIALNSRNGMIGIPEQTEDGIHITCLLNPKIRQRQQLQINNQALNLGEASVQYKQTAGYQLLPRLDADGYYIARVVDHHGDTRGTPWYTRTICTRATPGDNDLPVALARRLNG